jgi:hypothetical protein
VVWSVAFSPDGKFLASGGLDATVRFWSLATGAEVHRLSGHRGWVLSVMVTADGRRLASGGLDGTALVWRVPGLAWDKGLRGKALSPRDLDRLWSDLAGKDGPKAYAAVWRMAAAPDVSVPFLKERLAPAPKVDPHRIRRLIADLDADKFAVRQAAFKELERLGGQAEGALRRALQGKPSVEVVNRVEDLLARMRSSSEALRRRRAIQVLEYIGSAEASQVLQTLSRGAPGARETREAEEALRRLAGPLAAKR